MIYLWKNSKIVGLRKLIKIGNIFFLEWLIDVAKDINKREREVNFYYTIGYNREGMIFERERDTNHTISRINIREIAF